MELNIINNFEKKLNFLKILLLSLISIGFINLVILYVFFVIKKTSNILILVTFLVFLILSLITFFIYKKSKSKFQLMKSWGKVIEKKYDFEELNEFVDLSEIEKYERLIDVETANDLNLKNVFSFIDRTLTTIGENVLYRILRCPLINEKKLKERNELISKFTFDMEFRENVRLVLNTLGNEDSFFFNKLLFKEKFEKIKYSKLLIFPQFLSFIIAGLTIFNFKMYLPYFILMFIINLIIHYYVKRKSDYLLNSIVYLNKMIFTSEKLAVILKENFNSTSNSLDSLAKNVEKIKKNTRYLNSFSQNSGDILTILMEYLNILFLIHARSFTNVLDNLKASQKDLKEMFFIIGEIDSMQSVASFRIDIENWTTPMFNNNVKNIIMEDVYYPILENAVTNSIEIAGNGVVLTGSNMAGKSTFLRTVGINALMAQSIYTVTAKKYIAPFFNIVTSINRSDDINLGKSFYFYESERLKKIVNVTEENIPVLAIIDEMLAGTNSIERFSASFSILKYLTTKNSIVIAATHDLKLANAVKSYFDTFHFTDNVNSSGLDFDYKLKQGIATTRNAIKLLEYLKFPEDITNEAKNLTE